LAGPSHGTLVVVPATASSAAYVRYTPDAGYNGLDSFRYQWTYQKIRYDAATQSYISFGTATSNAATESIGVSDGCGQLLLLWRANAVVRRLL
jgi:hypothetical protein